MRHQGWVVGSFALVAAVACSTKAPDAAQLPVTSPVTCVSIGPVVRPALATLHPGDTLRLQIDSMVCGFSGVAHFRWLSSDTAVGTVDSASGLIHARSKGVAAIIAAMLEEPTVKGAAALQVVP